MSKTKQKLSDLLSDLSTLEETVECLREVIERDNFDNFDAGDVDDLCFQIERCAGDIRKQAPDLIS